MIKKPDEIDNIALRMNVADVKTELLDNSLTFLFNTNKKKF